MDHVKISIIVIDSRGDKHPEWVQTCLRSIQNQIYPVHECIVEMNRDLSRTIGKCWNDAVKKAKGDYIFLVGDDDFIAHDCIQVMAQHAAMQPNMQRVTTFITPFDNKTGIYYALQRETTGMIKKDYIVKHPFNEKLKIGIDREWIQEYQKRGDPHICIPYYYGHWYRKHDDYSCSHKMRFTVDPVDMYITCDGGKSFIDSLVGRFTTKGLSLHVATKFDGRMADHAKYIWCEWLGKDAMEVSKYECKAKKILRLHSFEAFTTAIHYVDFNAFDHVVFVADHIKDYVEDKVGKIDNAVVIPVGVKVDTFSLRNNKRNNKICYAGEISRKKGVGELLFIAKNMPDYEFHIAGKFTENDVSDYFYKNRPDNITLHPFSYDLNNWLQNYTYFINTSLREGNPITTLQAMSCGLKPIVRDWIGSDKIYGNGYVYRTMDDIREIVSNGYDPSKYRKFVEKNYDFEESYKKIEALIWE